ncbi:MAG: cobalamin biosynthesis protein CbiG [Gammaproteobacteria bacterium]|nr:MAG: cobalamin biosynthesis protein CbiG [Pseudomonadota bacterium]PIE38051.1 MAG: cobalamin biosynthesis protein CbiG [Gammaproteobacteria bacterium]
MIRIFALTEAGLDLAERLANGFAAEVDQPGDTLAVCYKPQPFVQTVQDSFRSGERQIFICATGIVIRTLAPVLKNKHEDPPVLVLDERGRFVIPLLSGHEGGSNEWGRIVADKLSAQLVLTTAEPYLEPVYMVGMGCERNCPESELRALLEACLARTNLAVSRISGLASIDVKADEKGLIRLAESLKLPYLTWSREQLSTVESQLSHRSEYVFRTVGVYGVAESAALYSAQMATFSPAELVLTKQKTKRATCSIARSFTSGARAVSASGGSPVKEDAVNTSL